MTKRFTLLALMASCILVGTLLNQLFAVDPPKSNTWKTLERAYAQANVELAQARLAQAESENKAAPNSVSDTTIEELEAGVQLTQDRVKQLDSNGNTATFGPQIIAASDEVQALEDDYNEAVKANSASPGAVPGPEIARAKAEIAVAKARLASLKALAQQPLEVRVQWQISQLQDEVRALWARPLIED